MICEIGEQRECCHRDCFKDDRVTVLNAAGGSER